MTATGWTFETIDNASACDIFALLDYWAEEPPAHVLLALRYFGERKRKAPRTEDEARSQLHGLQQMMGRGAQPLPPQVRAMAEWAEEQQAKLNRKKKRGES